MIFYIIKVTNLNFIGCDTLIAPPARSVEDWIVIRPMSESWEDVNWDGEEHQTCVNYELGTFCRLLYPGMVAVAGKWIAAWSWTHWALKPYIDQGTFQDGVAKLFWVSLLAIFVDFTCFLLCRATLILSYT
jgi:hypothetical protein